MPPLDCPSCQGKWAQVSGGLCGVCRTIDRLAAYIRGPQLPPESGPGIVGRLRGVIGELQDYSEELRGVVPCPTLAPPATPEEARRREGAATKAPGSPPVVGAAPKAAGPCPEPPPESAGVRVKKTKEETPTSSASSHRKVPPKEEEEVEPKEKKEKSTKARRRSRSGRRSPRVSRSRLASPVRPEGVKRESSPEDTREEIKRRKVQPRSPSRSPPRRGDHSRAAPSGRPLGSEWRGPIPAGRREPAPGQGKHFGKNKGKRKKARGQEPAAAEEEAEVVEQPELIDTAKLTFEQCRALQEVEVVTGSYWEAPVQAALKVQDVKIKAGEPYLTAQVLGTKNEDLLKAASGREGHLIEAHLCPAGCTGTPHSDGLIHVRTLRHLGRDREGWMSNMVTEAPDRGPLDELAALSREHDISRREGRPEVRREDTGRSVSPRSRDGDKRKRSRSKKRKRPRLKVEARKDLKAVFSATGADPDPAVRKRFRRKAAKIARKKSKSTKSSSGRSSSGSSDIESEERALFGPTNRVHAIGKRLPGTLLTAALEEAAEAMVSQEGGVYNVTESTLPPLFLKYYKQQLAPRMAPAMSREAFTLAHILDYSLRGRFTEALDAAAQRLKALEMQSQGVHWTVAQQQELLTVEGASMSTTPEFTEAARRAREEGRARLDASRPYGARMSLTGRTEDGSKGSGKKGGKGKGGKTEARKGEDKADVKKGKGASS
eukprot:s1097_g11.t1